MLVEAALIKLGTAAVRTAAKLWLSDEKIAAEVSASAVDIMSERLVSVRDKRKFNRLIENFAEEVVNRVEPIIDREFRGLEENERVATIEAVHDTFALAPLTDQDLFAADLDAGHLDRSIRARVPSQTRLLSASGTALYDLLLRECCGYVIEIARGLPQFSTNALTELLRRDREILDGIRDVLARLPQRDRTAGFDYDYRQLVARKLDQVEMYGVTLSDASRKYPLSVAYISLTAATERDDSVFVETRIEEQLAASDRVFIRDEAGLGKTTLLHWIAVRSARADFRSPLNTWNDTVPFFLPLRRYSSGNLPAPEQFLEEIGRHIADEMPPQWVHEQLRDGRAVLLIDGVDEVGAQQRHAAGEWLADLVFSFPKAKFVITSRPGGAPSQWFHYDRFAVVDLQPMTPRDIRTFIERWHDAMRSMTVDTGVHAEITEYEYGLVRKLESRTHIRKLAGYPLLCALLCALHKDRRAALPSNRMELYDVALQMMLERRDAERKINDTAGLNRTEKMLLLGDLAYWLIRNGSSDTEVDRALGRFAGRLKSMPQVESNALQVYQHLLVRSGLLRESVQGRVDFLHRTFQEYLAADAAMNDADDVGTVVANAHLDQWHEVVVMAVGCASRKQREELFSGLLSRALTSKTHRDTLDLLALASLETAPELASGLREQVEKRARRLLPPKSLTAAKSFASAGLFVLDLLANADPQSARQTVATIRAMALIGLSEAIPLLAMYRDDPRSGVRDELIRNWDSFDSEEYAKQVIPGAAIDEVVAINDPVKLHSLRHLSSITNLEVIWNADKKPDLTSLPKKIRFIRLTQSEEPVGSAAPIDLAPLTRIHGLESLQVIWPVIENFPALATLPALTELSIHCTELRPDTSLPDGQTTSRTATFRRTDDLTSLPSLGFLRALKELTLRDLGALRDLNGIGQWRRTLRSLTVINCPISDISGVTELPELELLILSGTQIADVSALSEMRRLTYLDLSNTPLTDISPLAALSGLRYLNLNGTRVSDIAPLRKLFGLYELHILYSQVRDLSALTSAADIVRGASSKVVSIVHNPFARP
jgi:hypothetical protein